MLLWCKVQQNPSEDRDNVKLLQHLKSGSKSTKKSISSKTEPLNSPNPYLDFVIDRSFK